MNDEPLSSQVIDGLMHSVALTISEIVIWRQKVRRLKKEISKSKTIEDDLIYKEVFRTFSNFKANGPPTGVISINGTIIKITLAHRHKAESVYGVDLVYEIEDKKIALIQYKKVSNGRFIIERNQLSKLRAFCYGGCPLNNKGKEYWFLEDSRIVALCPCYYVLVDELGEESILPACVIEAILDHKLHRESAKQEEFARGFSKEAFTELFAKCWLGAVYSSKPNIQSITDLLVQENHLVVECLEKIEKLSTPQ